MNTRNILAKHDENRALHVALKWYLSSRVGLTQKERDARTIATAYVELADAVRGMEGEGK